MYEKHLTNNTVFRITYRTWEENLFLSSHNVYSRYQRDLLKRQSTAPLRWLINPLSHSSPFHTETPHYLRSRDSPILRLFLFTQNQAASVQSCTHVSVHTTLRHSGSKWSKSWCWHLCVFSTFPRFPPVNLNMFTLNNNHMDAVIMCCDWDPDPLHIIESDKVTFFILYYIVT